MDNFHTNSMECFRNACLPGEFQTRYAGFQMLSQSIQNFEGRQIFA